MSILEIDLNFENELKIWKMVEILHVLISHTCKVPTLNKTTNWPGFFSPKIPVRTTFVLGIMGIKVRTVLSEPWTLNNFVAHNRNIPE